MRRLFRATTTNVLGGLLIGLSLVTIFWSGQARQANRNSEWRGEPSVRVPYEEGVKGQIFLPVEADGADIGPCLLDSGAQVHMMGILPAAARDAGLRRYIWVPESVVIGATGHRTGPVPNWTAGELRVGPVVITAPRLVELAGLSTTMDRWSGLPAGALCSAAVFLAAVVEIDWRTREIVFHRPGQLPAEIATLDWIPLEQHNRLPYVTLRLEDGQEGLFLVDTGMGPAIHFHHHAVTKFGLEPDRRTGLKGSRTSVGINGSIQEHSGDLQSVSIGKYRVGPVMAGFSAAPRTNDRKKFDGRIGRELLRQFRTIIDMRGGRMALVPYEGVLEPPR